MGVDYSCAAAKGLESRTSTYLFQSFSHYLSRGWGWLALSLSGSSECNIVALGAADELYEVEIRGSGSGPSEHHHCHLHQTATRLCQGIAGDDAACTAEPGVAIL